jgi:hypothetical protein
MLTGACSTPAITGVSDSDSPGLREMVGLSEDNEWNLVVVAPPGKGHRSITGDDSLRRCTTAILGLLATYAQMMQEDPLETRKIMTNLIISSM